MTFYGLADDAVGDAMRLVHAIRGDDQAVVLRALNRDPDEMRALAVVLASMVHPRNARPNKRLLAHWRQPPATVPDPHEPNLAPHGTHSAYNRHRKRGEEPCDLCREGERVYNTRASAERRASREQPEPAPERAERRPVRVGGVIRWVA